MTNQREELCRKSELKASSKPVLLILNNILFRKYYGEILPVLPGSKGRRNPL